MKYISFIGYGLLAISVVITGLFLGTGDLATKVFPHIDLMIQWTMAMLFIAVAAVVVLPLLNMVKNPKSMIRTLIGIGLVSVMLLVCYLLANDEPVVTAAGTYDDRTALLVSDAGLYAIYITSTLSILAIVSGWVMSILRKR